MDEITFHLHLNARHPWLKLEAAPDADEDTLIRLHSKDHRLYRERFPDGAGHPHIHKHVRSGLSGFAGKSQV